MTERVKDNANGGKASGGPGIDPHEVYHAARAEEDSHGIVRHNSVEVELGSAAGNPAQGSARAHRVISLSLDDHTGARETDVDGDDGDGGDTDKGGAHDATDDGKEEGAADSGEEGEATEGDGPDVRRLCSGRCHEATSTVQGGARAPPRIDISQGSGLARFSTFVSKHTKSALELATEVSVERTAWGVTAGSRRCPLAHHLSFSFYTASMRGPLRATLGCGGSKSWPLSAF